MQGVELVRDFLSRQKLGAISTVHPDGSPEVAIIQVTLGDVLNIVFDSFPGSRKLANIERDNRIAMVIGWDQNITVQIEGRAQPASAEEEQRLKYLHVANCPLEAEFLKQGAQLFTVSPHWVRYSDFRGEPVIFELSGRDLQA